MCRTKKLAGFIVSFIFMITTFAGCAANMGAVNTPETAYHPKLPAGINSFDAAVKDLAGLLENRKDGLDILFDTDYCRSYGIQDLTLAKEGYHEIEKGLSGAATLSFAPPPSSRVYVQHLKNIDVGRDMLKVSSRLFVLYTDLPNLPINVINASIPGWAQVDLVSQVALYLNSKEDARRAADDLYFIQQNYKNYYQKHLALFETRAAEYRKLAIKPQVSEEQRKYIVQAEAMAQQKDYDRAIDLNLKAIALDPVSYPGAYSNLALLSAQLHRFNQAIDYMKQYLMLVPDAKDARSAQDSIYKWQLAAPSQLNARTQVSTDPADAFVEVNISDSGLPWNYIGRAPKEADFRRSDTNYKFCVFRVSKPGYSTEEKSFSFESLPPEVHIVLQQSGSGQDSHGFLGLTFLPVTEALAKSMELPKQEGLLVKEVSKDSPADRAGLKPGDIILTAGGREIMENIDLPRFIASTPIGGAAVLGIYRNGREHTVKVIVGSMPG